MVKHELEPIDPTQCQAEKRIGSFMSFGIPKLIRCTNKPVWIATEKTEGKDGLRGAMSLCADCRKVLEIQQPNFVTYYELAHTK